MLKRFLLLALLCQLSWVNNLTAQGNAGQAGEFLRWGVGAKALGLGRAFTSISDDASALYWNPAGLSALSRSGGALMFMHVPLQEGASFNYFAGGVPLSLFFIKASNPNPFISFIQEFNVGFGVLWHSLGEFEFYNEGASKVEDPSQNTITQSAFYLSVSYPLNRLIQHTPLSSVFGWTRHLKGDLNIGLTTKFVKQDLFGVNGTATSLDLGFKYTHSSGLFNLGLMLRDINQAEISYGANIFGDEIPATGVLGLSVVPPFGKLRGLLLAFDYGIMKPSTRDRDFMFGLEYDLSVLNARLPMKLRIGTNSNYESFTFGINFSPELILGRDWVPYGDVAFANDKSSFDAAGTRFSISLDQNPFTAQYWYRKAMNQMNEFECGNLFEIKSDENITGYLKYAEKAKNPGNHAYRYEAVLRRADLNFLTALNEFLGSNGSDLRNSDKSTKIFEKIKYLYTTGAAKCLNEDYGKNEFNRELYFKSFIYYVQCLILSNDLKQAIELCANYGRSWGKNIHILQNSNGISNAQKLAAVNYLHANALYKSNRYAEAQQLVHEKLNQSSLAKYLAAHFAFLKNDVQEVLALLNDINLNDSFFPAYIFLPLTNDCTFGDEILFLRAASLYKMSKSTNTRDYLAEFARIPRFFPDSDLAKFLTNGEGALFKMIDYYEAGDDQNIDKIISNLIDSYIKTFSFGALKEEFYTYNYK